MSTVLLGWELGGNLGHASRLGRIAQRLVTEGHSPVFALKNIVDTVSAIDPARYEVLQAPVLPPRRTASGPFTASTYADILAIRGFGKQDELAALVRAWDRVLARVQPDLVVADAAPTLCLAAWRRVPTVLVGNGFTVPPAHAPLFPEIAPREGSADVQHQILDVIQAVQRSRLGPVPESVTSFFSESARFVLVFPELDPYATQRRDACLGPLDVAPFLPLPAEPRFFAYLGVEYPRVQEILLAIGRSRLPGSVFLRGASQSMLDSLRQVGLDVSDAPADLSQLLPTITTWVHHAGHGLSELGLASGRSQILLPTQLEQSLSAQLLRNLGVAGSFAGQFPVDSVRQAIHWAMHDRPLADRAAELARQIQARGPYRALDEIAQVCQQLLAGRP